MLYPCEEGDLCLRRGGVTCLDANGCDPDDLRICGMCKQSTVD